MRIVLDGSDSVVGVRAIRRYTINLTRELICGYPDDHFTVFLNYFRGNSKVVDAIVADRRNASSVRYGLPRRFSLPLWELLRIPRVDWFTGPGDVFHSLGEDCPPAKSGVHIMTLHGLAYMARPDLICPAYVSEKQAWLKKTVRRAHYFISVSEKTKSEFLSYFPFIDEKRVRVIPLGIGSEFSPLHRSTVRRSVLERFGLCRPYILYVGGLQPHKNISGILRGFECIAQKHADVELVLVGKEKEEPTEVKRLIEALKLQTRVRIFPYIDQEDDGLTLLYNGAECFVFPSFVEGWTSPPLEAMACGTPVVTSNVSSLPETVGNAAVKVNPCCHEAIGHAMDRVLTDSELRMNLKHKGLQHAANFSWKRCAESTRALYKDAVGAY